MSESSERAGPQAIAVLESIMLNGSRQWISLRGTDTRNPVLLYLAGGPGGSDLAWTRKYLHALEAYFVVVNWEQPGSGKSYGAVSKMALTPERYVEDGLALVRRLQVRFGQNKIYLMGHSWGALLGVWLVQRNPAFFHAYVGVSPLVSATENDRTAYAQALQIVAANGDTRTQQRLEKQGPPPYLTGDIFSHYAVYTLVLHRQSQGNNGARRSPSLLRDVLAAPEYGLVDKVNVFRGMMRAFNRVYPQLKDVDLRQDAPRLDVPVYFVLGRRDTNTLPQLAERYYEQLDAPHKALAWFEEAGHLAHFEEPERFQRFLVDTVLGQ